MLEHMVDTVAILRERHQSYRILRAVKIDMANKLRI